MAEHFITVSNGIITGRHCGDINVDLANTPYKGHEKIVVPSNARISDNERLEYYTSDWKRKPDILLIKEGIMPISEGYVIENDQLRIMTSVERIETGLNNLPQGFKIKNGEIVEIIREEPPGKEPYYKWDEAAEKYIIDTKMKESFEKQEKLNEVLSKIEELERKGHRPSQEITVEIKMNLSMSLRYDKKMKIEVLTANYPILDRIKAGLKGSIVRLFHYVLFLTGFSGWKQLFGINFKQFYFNRYIAQQSKI